MIRPMLYLGTDIFLVLFSLTDTPSLNNCKIWYVCCALVTVLIVRLAECLKTCKDAKFLLVGTNLSKKPNTVVHDQISHVQLSVPKVCSVSVCDWLTFLSFSHTLARKVRRME